MEVTTVSPSPASPTEGDDLCETDVTTVAIHSVTLLICLCGLAGNGAVIGLLNLKTRNSEFFELTFVDFLFLLLSAPSSLLFLVEDVSCSHILPLLYLNLLFQLLVMSLYWQLFCLMRSSDAWYMEEICKLCCRCGLPERLLWVLGCVQGSAFFGLFTVIPTVTFLCPSQEQELCRAALIFMYTFALLLFVIPVVIFHTVDFIKAKWGSQKQQPKRRDIVIFITLLLTALLILWNFLQQLGCITVSSDVALLLVCIHSTIKPFMYFLVGRCQRPCSVASLQLSLQRVFEETEENTAHSDDRDMSTGV